MNVKQTIISVVVFLLIGLMFIKTWSSAKGEIQSDIPIVNDAWANSLQAIHDDSENNTGKPWEKGIITSWWDFGHHFKYLSDRGTTFDGGTQVTPQAHWVGKLLLSSDEDVSVGILRMLDCGGNKAFDSLTSAADTPFAINVLNRWFKKELKADDVGQAIKYLNCTPTSGYVIASEDMVGKAGVWAHFGNWDFNRADMWVNVKKMPKEQAISYMLSHNYTKTNNEAEQLWTQIQTMTESDANNWIAPWPGYAGTNDCALSDCMTDFNTTGVPQNDTDLVMRGKAKFKKCLQCSNGINVIDDSVSLPNGQLPHSFVYIKDGNIIEKKYPNATFQYSFILTPDNKLIASTPELANSLFTKLFFMNATGLKHFKLLTEQKGIDNFKIFVYKVDWNE